MKRSVGLASLMLLTGCLSAPEQAMIDRCVWQGLKPEMCECIRSTLKANTNDKVYKVVVLTAAGVDTTDQVACFSEADVQALDLATRKITDACQPS